MRLLSSVMPLSDFLLIAWQARTAAPIFRPMLYPVLA
jgi:hypothetical protein